MSGERNSEKPAGAKFAALITYGARWSSVSTLPESGIEYDARPALSPALVDAETVNVPGAPPKESLNVTLAAETAEALRHPSASVTANKSSFVRIGDRVSLSGLGLDQYSRQIRKLGYKYKSAFKAHD